MNAKFNTNTNYHRLQRRPFKPSFGLPRGFHPQVPPSQTSLPTPLKSQRFSKRNSARPSTLTSTPVSATSTCPSHTLLLDPCVFHPALHSSTPSSTPSSSPSHLIQLSRKKTQIETVIFPEQAEIKSVKIYAKTENHTDASTTPNWLRVVPNTEMGDACTVKLISGKDAEKLATVFKFHNAEGQFKATFKSRHRIDVVTDLLSYIPPLLTE